MTDTHLQHQLLHETAQIPWRELQRFFAAGQAIAVHASLDLLQVANTLATDDATSLKTWMAAGKVDVVSDQQAAQWFEQDALVWAVVIKPWVLVQQRTSH